MPFNAFKRAKKQMPVKEATVKKRAAKLSILM